MTRPAAGGAGVPDRGPARRLSEAGIRSPKGFLGCRTSRLRPAFAALLLLAAAPALAAQPIPLRAGTYCGPGDARIVVDVAHDLVEVDGFVCAFPIIAADKMQSQSCSRPGTTTGKQIFDFRVVGRDFIHDAAWYRICGPVPAPSLDPRPSDPNAAPVKTGGCAGPMGPRSAGTPVPASVTPSRRA